MNNINKNTTVRDILFQARLINSKATEETLNTVIPEDHVLNINKDGSLTIKPRIPFTQPVE